MNKSLQSGGNITLGHYIMQNIFPSTLIICSDLKSDIDNGVFSGHLDRVFNVRVCPVTETHIQLRVIEQQDAPGDIRTRRRTIQVNSSVAVNNQGAALLYDKRSSDAGVTTIYPEGNAVGNNELVCQ